MLGETNVKKLTGDFDFSLETSRRGRDCWTGVLMKASTMGVACESSSSCTCFLPRKLRM